LKKLYKDAKLKVYEQEKTSYPSKKSPSPVKPQRKVRKPKTDENGYVHYWEFNCPFIGSFCNGFRICHAKGIEVLKEDCKSCQIPQKKFLKVEFVKDCLDFVGVDGFNYGPFLKGDIVELPIENIPPLLRGRFARVVIEKGVYS